MLLLSGLMARRSVQPAHEREATASAPFSLSPPPPFLSCSSVWSVHYADTRDRDAFEYSPAAVVRGHHSPASGSRTSPPSCVRSVELAGRPSRVTVSVPAAGTAAREDPSFSRPLHERKGFGVAGPPWGRLARATQSVSRSTAGPFAVPDERYSAQKINGSIGTAWVAGNGSQLAGDSRLSTLAEDRLVDFPRASLPVSLFNSDC